MSITNRPHWMFMVVAVACLSLLPVSLHAQVTLVRDGAPNAQIIIAPDAPPMVKLAATELQEHLQKMSTATLPIRTQPQSDLPVSIFLGASAAANELKIQTNELRHGAFRMVSQKDRLILIGDDTRFVPAEPWNRDGSSEENVRLYKEWDARTGDCFGYPYGNLFKQYNPALDIWDIDGRGSINAVYELLRSQGVRWYLPDDMGIIIPQKRTIEIPAMDRTVRPDFAVRYPYQYGREFVHEAATRQEVLWRLRLGENRAPDLISHLMAHGINPVHSRDEVKAAHPEYFLLNKGKRDTTTIEDGRPCLSSPGLLQKNVKYIRSMYDILDATVVSVMPQDGYGMLCQCDLCKGKDTPGRGWDGTLSDYVWGYIDQVAREVYKTHPDRKVVCCAYSSYLLPPENIEKLSPNILVGICQHRYTFIDPAQKKKFDQVREAWEKKLPEGSKQILIYDYYLHTNPRNFPGLPFFFPKAIDRDLKSLRGKVVGDYVEVFRDKTGIQTLAVDHLNLYITSRLWWDVNQDVDALLNEYYQTYYGPAAEPMKQLVENCEKNLLGMDKNVAALTKNWELLDQADKLVPADSVYAKRIDLLRNYITPTKNMLAQLAKGRGDVPEAVGFERNIKDLKLDGKLDENFWQNLREFRLSDVKTGAAPAQQTTFRMAWAGDSLILGIRCADSDAKNLTIGTTRPEDPALWNGDCVEILIETQSHAYYQIAVNPAGMLADLDRQRDLNLGWNSSTQVATFIGDGYWSAEIRIPAMGTQQTSIDSLMGVAGNKPVEAYPWFFNVCRQRVRGQATEATAFCPTGKDSFHDTNKFAKLSVR